jgi:hypothetical protein
LSIVDYAAIVAAVVVVYGLLVSAPARLAARRPVALALTYE